MINSHQVAASFRYQSFMTTKDWYMLAVLSVVSSVLWAWVWVEYQKPIVDPSWFWDRVAVASTPHVDKTYVNHPPKL